MDKCALRKLDLNALNLEAVKAVESCQKSEAYLLRVIEVVSERELHLDCGLPSLYSYCTRLLHISDGIAYALIAVINKGKEVPELIAAVESGKVSLSKAKKICSVITPKNHKEWIDLATYETSRVIERCVAGANPKEAVKESAQYKSADRIEFKLGVSEEWMELLGTTKDLLSQKQSRAVTSEEALLFVMREFNDKHNPVKKAERAMARVQKKAALDLQKAKTELAEQQCPGTVTPSESADKKPMMAKSIKRKPLKRLTIHAVNHRDQGQCTHVSEFGRCEERRWLDHHHIIPVSQSGSNEIENLTTLCHAHHKMQHRELAYFMNSRSRSCNFL